MDIEKRIENIKKQLNNSADISSRIIKNKKIGYIFLESVSSDDKISDYLVKSIINTKTNKIENAISNSKLKKINEKDIQYLITSGFTIVLTEKETFAIETKANIDRSIEDSKSEAIIRGPKDSFTENYMTNIGLIRKRIKDENLVFDELKIGKRTKTKISITYINNIVEEKKIKKIKEHLKQLKIDGLIDSGPLRDYLTKENHCAFPTIISTERPDKCAESLLNGKIIIIVENTPFALIIPGLLIDIFHTPEDNYQQPINITITRILKLLAFIITLFTPALYIALTTYNFEIIPDNLLISIAIQRQGVPFPTVIETIIMLITFEILRESDIRLPNQMGAAVSIVGALVLGDAAVKAGIVSPIVIIVVAITSVSGLLFTDIDVVNGIRIWRFILILAATLLGLIGLLIATIILITKLASLEILDIPYLSAISPFNLESQKNAILKYSKTKIKNRPFYLKPKQRRKVGEK
jgi:spore germination protein KA